MPIHVTACLKELPVNIPWDCSAWQRSAVPCRCSSWCVSRPRWPCRWNKPSKRHSGEDHEDQLQLTEADPDEGARHQAAQPPGQPCRARAAANARRPRGQGTAFQVRRARAPWCPDIRAEAAIIYDPQDRPGAVGAELARPALDRQHHQGDDRDRRPRGSRRRPRRRRSSIERSDVRARVHHLSPRRLHGDARTTCCTCC